MYISRFCWNLRACSVSKFGQHFGYASIAGEIMTSDLVPKQPQPHPKRKRQRKPMALSTSSTLTDLSISGQASMEGVSMVAESLDIASIVKESSPSSTFSVPLREKVRKNPNSQLSIGNVPIMKSKPKSKRDPRTGRDQKVYPSKASGGIPNPTKEYLDGSKQIPQNLFEPQHLLVVIDLNGTLLYRPSRKAPTTFVTRPHACQFLQYCVDTFTVVIWSSARPENVRNMCNTILTPDIRNKVTAVWGRDKFGLSRADFQLRVQCYKRLSKIWQDPEIARSHPRHQDGYRWDQTNTVLIDDSCEKARSEPHSLIEVPEWFGDINETDDVLPQVHDYLNHLSMHANVSACLHAQPFRAVCRHQDPTLTL